MAQREKKTQQNALNGYKHPPEPHLHHNRGGADRQCPQIQRQMRQPRTIRPFDQMRFARRTQLFQNLGMGHRRIVQAKRAIWQACWQCRSETCQSLSLCCLVWN